MADTPCMSIDVSARAACDRATYVANSVHVSRALRARASTCDTYAHRSGASRRVARSRYRRRADGCVCSECVRSGSAFRRDAYPTGALDASPTGSSPGKC
jgi:hypothetical protein